MPDPTPPPRPHADKAPAASYIIVRANKRPTFRRAGIQFSAEWLPLERAELGAGVEKILRDEPMLDVKDATADEVEAITRNRPRAQDPRSGPELYAALVGAQKELEAVRKENEDLRARMRDLRKRPEGDPMKRGQ